MVRTQGNIKQLLVCSEDTSSVLWFILEKQEKDIKWTFFVCYASKNRLSLLIECTCLAKKYI